MCFCVALILIDLSGVPGTGKTATVREVIGGLQRTKKMRPFDYIEINGMKLSDPGHVYPLLWRHLSGEEKLCSSHAALKRLKAYMSASPRPIVVLLDELDALMQKRQSILYHFFEWTGLESAKLIVVAIANTMDLPERMLTNRISSRMGLNRINFTPYQYSQLQAIIKHRLAPYKDWFHVDALEMCARKVSSVSGDARRAIAFATRAVDHIRAQARRNGEAQPAPGSISLSIMNSILSSAFTGTPVFALQSCTGLHRLMIQSICHAWKVQALPHDTCFYNICNLFWQNCRNKDIRIGGQIPLIACVKQILWALCSAGLIRLEPANGDIALSTKVMMLFTEEDLNNISNKL